MGDKQPWLMRNLKEFFTDLLGFIKRNNPISTILRMLGYVFLAFTWAVISFGIFVGVTIQVTVLPMLMLTALVSALGPFGAGLMPLVNAAIAVLDWCDKNLGIFGVGTGGFGLLMTATWIRIFRPDRHLLNALYAAGANVRAWCRWLRVEWRRALRNVVFALILGELLAGVWWWWWLWL